MQLIWCLLWNFYLNMFRASLCPSSGEQECTLPHVVFCTALWKLLFDSSQTVTFTVHTARVPAPHNHSQHNQCRIPYAGVHTLVLLMMGVMTPETCWDRSSIINIKSVASCWFLFLHPTLTTVAYVISQLITSNVHMKLNKMRYNIRKMPFRKQKTVNVWNA